MENTMQQVQSMDLEANETTTTENTPNEERMFLI